MSAKRQHTQLLMAQQQPRRYNGLNFAVLIFLSIDKSKYHHESKIRNYVIRPFLKIRFSFGFSWVLIRRANNYFFTLLLLLIYIIVFFSFQNSSIITSNDRTICINSDSLLLIIHKKNYHLYTINTLAHNS